MRKARIPTGAIASGLAVFVLAGCGGAVDGEANAVVVTTADARSTVTTPHEGLIYGRVTLTDGDVYEGRLRWGREEEALWSNFFNGFRDGNPWAELAPSDELPKEGPSFSLFGIRIRSFQRTISLRRPFMTRFGDIARIDARGRDLTVTLKSGTVVELDRYSADDLADGVHVRQRNGEVIDIGERKIRSIEMMPNTESGDDVPMPMYGTVRTRDGAFTGLLQWDREACLGTDMLVGMSDAGERSVRFDRIRSIERRTRNSALVTLVDGSEIVLSDTRQVGGDNRGVYVDDPRYGRVLVSWDAFDRVDFSPGPVAPAYDSYAPGRALTGTVVTRSGDHVAGRLVYDLDESETTETLDAPRRGVDYTIAFDRIASIALPAMKGGTRHATVTLRGGESLELEMSGDLGKLNAGLLVFTGGTERPTYVPWSDITRIELDAPH